MACSSHLDSSFRWSKRSVGQSNDVWLLGNPARWQTLIMFKRFASPWGISMLSTPLTSGQTRCLATVSEMGTRWCDALVSSSVKIPLVRHRYLFPRTRQAMSEIRLPCGADVGQSRDWPTANTEYEPENDVTLCAYKPLTVWSPPDLGPAEPRAGWGTRTEECALFKRPTPCVERTVFSRNPSVRRSQLPVQGIILVFCHSKKNYNSNSYFLNTSRKEHTKFSLIGQDWQILRFFWNWES